MGHIIGNAIFMASLVSMAFAWWRLARSISKDEWFYKPLPDRIAIVYPWVFLSILLLFIGHEINAAS